MTRAVFRVLGARLPLDLEHQTWDVNEALTQEGLNPTHTITLELPRSLGEDSASDLFIDLMRIAAYAYAADQRVRRGGPADVHDDAWSRAMTLCLPVRSLEVWRNPAVQQALCAALDYVSGDSWTFRFTQDRHATRQTTLSASAAEPQTDCDCVYLFSGGLDSLCAVVDAAVTQRRRPLLVHHAASNNVIGQQEGLLAALQVQFGDCWRFPSLRQAVSRSDGQDPHEYTQRTRAFLFAALGAAVADRLGLREVCLADNGIVSLNLPLSPQLIGSTASRSTHPHFLRLVNRLLATLTPSGPRVLNPLWRYTRADTLDLLRRAGAVDLVRNSVSCVHTRLRTTAQPHCGVCSQCVDRRFATTAAGLEGQDPASGYVTDIFRHPLEEGEPRSLVLSYVNFAESVKDLDDARLLRDFPEIIRAIDSAEAGAPQKMADLRDLLRRHGRTIHEVLATLLSRSSEDLLAQSLPSSSLLPLWIGAGVARFPGAGVPTAIAATSKVDYIFRREGGGWCIVFAGRESILSDKRGARLLHYLLQRPGAELHALALNQVGRKSNSTGTVLSMRDAIDDELSASDDGGVPLADADAVRSAQRRLVDLDADLVAARTRGDQQSIGALQGEFDKITRYLAQVRGLGGRIRKADSAAEKARTSVWQAIRAVFKQLRSRDPELCNFLEASIHTGSSCRYEPVRDVRWVLE